MNKTFWSSKTCRATFETFPLSCRAPVVDVSAWGESLDHLLDCKSERTHGVFFFYSSRSLKILLRSLNNPAAQPPISPWIACSAPAAAARTNSSLKFIKSLWRIEPSRRRGAETRLPMGAAAVRLDHFTLLWFIYEGGRLMAFHPTVAQASIWRWLKGVGRVLPPGLCSRGWTEMNTAYRSYYTRLSRSAVVLKMKIFGLLSSCFVFDTSKKSTKKSGGE